MQIVIDIDEKRFQDIQRISEVQAKRRTPTLEQVVANGTPIEPKTDGDCISRAEAMTEIQMNAKRYSISKEFGGMGQVEWSDFLLSIVDILSILRDLPSVQPRTGHWVLDGSDNSLECINCGCVIYANDIMRGEPHYCPNCGRRMSEVSE